MLVQTDRGIVASVYGIKRYGFPTVLDACRWIANVSGKPVSHVIKAEKIVKNK